MHFFFNFKKWQNVIDLKYLHKCFLQNNTSINENVIEIGFLVDFYNHEVVDKIF